MNQAHRHQLSDYDLAIPDELIAQYPPENRDKCRLMVVDRSSGSVVTRTFSDLPAILSPGDVMVLNDTRVFPARLLGNLLGTEHAVEVFLLKEVGVNKWETLVRPGKRAKVGQQLTFEGDVSCQILEQTEDGRLMQFSHNYSSIYDYLEEHGRSPLPPYITRDPEQDDKESYQTVFARERGAVAAPTAGLHFTQDLIAKIEAAGIKVVYLTHHVGLGTFQPVRSEDITVHQMGAESYEITVDAAKEINSAIDAGNKVAAVGTTVTIAMESTVDDNGHIVAGSDNTALFIYPPYKFKAVQTLITNFHQPKSTLIMLVSAFAGRDLIFKAYRQAVAEKYHFFSYGDAMIII